MKLILFAILCLFCWAIVHGGTAKKQPGPVIYDDDHDVSGLLEED